jgi:hypothetical protein
MEPTNPAWEALTVWIAPQVFILLVITVGTLAAQLVLLVRLTTRLDKLDALCAGQENMPFTMPLWAQKSALPVR